MIEAGMISHRSNSRRRRRRRRRRQSIGRLDWSARHPIGHRRRRDPIKMKPKETLLPYRVRPPPQRKTKQWNQVETKSRPSKIQMVDIK